MGLKAPAYLRQSPGPSGKDLATPLPSDIFMTRGKGSWNGSQATGQAKFCHLPWLTLSPVAASNPHCPWMQKQMGPVRRESRQNPGVHLAVGPVGLSGDSSLSSSPSLCTSGILCDEAQYPVPWSSLSSLSGSLAYKFEFQSWHPGLYTR